MTEDTELKVEILADRLKEAGVEFVFKANYNSNSWNMAIPQGAQDVTEETFIKAAKKAGFAFHHDKVDLYYNGEKIDFEAYYTSIGTYSLRHVVKGE